jgi:DNA invertase Pin-like site-specific DNA recombinase
MKAVVYLRVSTLHQKESRAGLNAQLKACKEKAVHLKAREVYVFKDSGFSGFTHVHERPGLSNALIILQPGDVFIVASRDRIARDTGIAAQVELIIAGKKAMLVSAAGEGTTLPGVKGLQARRMADVKSELFRGLIIENTKRSLRIKKHQRERTGTVPYGLKLAKDGIGLEVCQSELVVIKLAKTLRSQGLTLRNITKKVNELGHRSRKGSLFHHNQIVHMLEDNNRFVMADSAHNKILFLPYGYTFSDDGKRERCPQEQKIIALAQELHKKGYSLRRVTQELNRRGYRSRVGTIFHHRQISRMLQIAQADKEGSRTQWTVKNNIKYGFMLSRDNSTIKPCPHEQEVIQVACLLKSQKFSLRMITQELNARSYKSRKGKPFQLTQIARMIKALDT